jgi:hypothetical protein
VKITQRQSIPLGDPCGQLGRSNHAGATAHVRGFSGTFSISVLLDPGSAALNQNDQYDDKQNPSDDLDNRGAIHKNSPFVQQAAISASESRQNAGNARQAKGIDPDSVQRGTCQRNF